MKKEALAAVPAAEWALVPLVLFFVFFTVLWLWTYRRGGSEHYRRLAQMPLEKGDE